MLFCERDGPCLLMANAFDLGIAEPNGFCRHLDRSDRDGFCETTSWQLYKSTLAFEAHGTKTALCY